MHLEFRYSSSECLEDFEVCDGTEKYCSRIEDSSIRTRCLTSRRKGAYLSPFSKGCPESGSRTDERCVGTKVWCANPLTVKLYGSAQACLALRNAASTEDQSKMPFLLPDVSNCVGDQPRREECVGTEAFCTAAPDKMKCFEKREKLAFSPVWSGKCGSMLKNDEAEVCYGTSEWCKQEKMTKLYGSAETCLKFRTEPPPPSQWLGSGACSNDTEECSGTEKWCGRAWPHLGVACLAARQAPPYLFPSKEACQKAADSEQCLGTPEYCRAHFKEYEFLYQNEQSCLSKRGYDLGDVTSSLSEKLTLTTELTIVTIGTNVTQAAMLRELVTQKGTAKSAKEAAKKDLGQYLEKVKGFVKSDKIQGVVQKVISKM
ncbi:hypothetical protein CDD83_4514 [Cordyceps sp. RAO-2017]|nr:hypothetical protein CDD83_4514 [Cordyceps sp. RAO-2017]